MTYEYIKSFLQQLGFETDDFKNYNINIDNYSILICLQIDESNNVINSNIDYGEKIKVEHGSITNLSKKESIVQLECVVRLLKKGYRPENIELEKTYRLGHKDKGRLDV